MAHHKFYLGDVMDCLRMIPDNTVQCVVTSPPYWGLRDYGVSGQIGLEATPEEFIQKMAGVFREVRRVLRKDGTCWVNFGDSYAAGGNAGNQKSYSLHDINKGCLVGPKKAPEGLKPKDLIGMPWRVAFALQAEGWYLRSDIIWSKPNPMPESVTDRPTKSHEYIFLLTKSAKYYYDNEAIREDAVYKGDNNGVGFGHGTDENLRGRGRISACSFSRKVNEQPPPGQPLNHRENRENKEYCGKRNKRTVWEIPTKSFPGAHFSTFPTKLVEPCILAGSKPGDIILDPFGGSGTVSLVSQWHQRSSIYIDLNPDYLDIALERNGFTGLCHADTWEIVRPIVREGLICNHQ